MLSATVRGIIVIVGGLLALGGLTVLFSGIPSPWTGVWLIAMGAFLIVIVLIERRRYRSEAADRAGDPYGPGGGEPEGAVEARFRLTDEVFIDPTSRLRMRVFVDPATGERRYRAEG
jgi:hypothetical protein